MKSLRNLQTELASRATKHALNVQNSSVWVDRIAKCEDLEQLCKLTEELQTKHTVCKYPKPYAQAAEQAASQLIGHILKLRITEQNRLEMLRMVGQQRSDFNWLQRACIHYGL